MAEFRLGLSRIRHSSLLACGFAIISLRIALALRLAVAESLPPGFPFLTFFPAGITTAFLAGAGAAILVAMHSDLAAWWFLIPPVNVLEHGLPDGRHGHIHVARTPRARPAAFI